MKLGGGMGEKSPFKEKSGSFQKVPSKAIFVHQIRIPLGEEKALDGEEPWKERTQPR